MELVFAGVTIPFSLAVAAAAAAAVLLLLRSTLGNKRRRSGRRHPRMGTVFHELLHLRKLHDYHADLASRHGSFRMSHFTRDYVYLVDPAAVEHILRTNFSNYGKGSYHHELMGDLLGDGIFAVDGEKWRQQRKLASFEFTARNLRDYSSDVFRRKAVALALVIAEAADSQLAVNIYDLLMKSTLDSIFKVGFGVDLDTLSGSNAEGSSFGKAFDASSEVILRRYYDVFWKIKRLLNIGAEAELKEHLRVMDEFVYKVIRKKKMEQMIAAQVQDAPTVRREDILSRFLAQKEQGGDEMDMKYLRDVVLNLVIAGRDTTAGTLSWFLYMLCKHPRVQEKVAMEVAMATGAEGSSTPMTDFATVLTEEALDKMQYLHAALTETLRLYPAVPLDGKLCLSDDTLPDGFDVREGDVVCYVPYSMGRMKSLWGEDAAEFRPERWLDEKGAFRPESPFKFAAFQAGPRVCLGKDFAYRQMKIFAAVLVKFFSFQLDNAGDADHEEVTYRNALTLIKLSLDRVQAFSTIPPGGANTREAHIDKCCGLNEVLKLPHTLSGGTSTTHLLVRVQNSIKVTTNKPRKILCCRKLLQRAPQLSTTNYITLSINKGKECRMVILIIYGDGNILIMARENVNIEMGLPEDYNFLGCPAS